MAPTSISESPAKRYYCQSYDMYGNCYSGWSTWGRWVALGVIIIALIALGFLFSCINSRRRRRRGMAPMYGTGWMGGGSKYGNNAPNYYSNQPYNGGAAPPYEPPIPGQQTGNTFNSNEGYYGQNHYELQQPQSSYHPQRGGDPVYDAPSGPPPKKGDGVIR